MTFTQKFVLNLTNDKISLCIKQDKVQKILDSFNPNEPAASIKLKNLYYLAKALDVGNPKLDINLPEELLKNETLITEKLITSSQAIEIINKRIKNGNLGIITFSIEHIGTRATSVTYIQKSLINEVIEFVEKAGFSINKFIVGKYSFEYKRKNILNFKNYLKSINFLNFNSISRPSYALLTLMFFGFFLYIYHEKESYNNLTAPEIIINLNINKQQVESTNQKNKINFRTKVISKNAIKFNELKTEKLFTSLENTNFKNINKLFFLDYETLPKLSNIKIPTNLIKKNDYSHSDLALNFKIIEEIIENEKPLLSSDLNLENKIDYSELFKKHKKESNNKLIEKKNVSTLKVITSYKPKFKPVYPLNPLELKFYDSIIKKKKISIARKLKDNKNKVIIPEFDTAIMEYAVRISPLKKPVIIDAIKILNEPTISSGALVFVQKPRTRPDVFKELKIVKPSQIKIIAKATRSPSIPEKASVGYNSTKRNFIDLDRTNLIGIVGKSSNPSALLRLSNGKIIKLKVGQWFEGWRVFAIDRDKIHVENGFKQEILRMPG